MDALGPNNQIEADAQSFDEGFAPSSTSTSYVTSIASQIRRGIEENGRTYPSFGKHQYGLPVDEEEQERNDFQHCKFLLVLENKLFLAPIADEPTDILDLGTGSGIWCIDMADKYPTATVLGVDLAPIQPNWLPPNCHFEVDDIEEDWVYSKNKFDFIHARDLYLAVIPDATSDDNTLPANSAYRQTCDMFYEIGEKMGAPVQTAKHFKTKMEAANFMDVQEVRFKIPCGPWPRDQRLKKIGALERAHLYEGAEALLIRGMTTVLGRSNEEAQVVFAHLRDELYNQRIHGYVFFYVVIGRKAPRLDSDSGHE